MSAPDVNASPFGDAEATAKADGKEVVNGAIEYLESAVKTAEGQADVLVKEVADDAEALAFKIATEHGFQAYLALFKSSIDAGKVNIEATISVETKTALDKGIAKLKAIETA